MIQISTENIKVKVAILNLITLDCILEYISFLIFSTISKCVTLRSDGLLIADLIMVSNLCLANVFLIHPMSTEAAKQPYSSQILTKFSVFKSLLQCSLTYLEMYETRNIECLRIFCDPAIASYSIFLCPVHQNWVNFILVLVFLEYTSILISHVICWIKSYKMFEYRIFASWKSRNH